jgi:hypothetical protein
MLHLKTRLFALLIIAVFAGLLCYEWYSLRQEGRYSIKIASFAPVGIVGGLFIFLFPAKAGKPETASEKILVLLVFVIGMAAGLVNWYLMDPGFFTFH